MRPYFKQAFFFMFIILLVSACASPQASEPTEVPATPTEAVEEISFAITAHSSRLEPALERLTGLYWEGGYIWTPFVVYHDGVFNFFYNGYSSETRGVGHATSEDGMQFVRSGDEPVLESSEEGRVLLAPVVYVDDEGTWVMYIVSDEARTGLAGDKILRFTADNPQGPWDGGQVVYEAPNEDPWTHEIVIRSVVVEDEQILLGFHARYEGERNIGILRSADGLEFELISAAPVLDKGIEGSWEQDAVSAPILFATENGYEMFYLGNVQNAAARLVSHEGLNLWIGYATSNDGISWEKSTQNPVLNIPEEEGDAYISGLKVDDTYYIYYVYSQGAYGIGAASITKSP